MASLKSKPLQKITCGENYIIALGRAAGQEQGLERSFSLSDNKNGYKRKQLYKNMLDKSFDFAEKHATSISKADSRSSQQLASTTANHPAADFNARHTADSSNSSNNFSATDHKLNAVGAGKQEDRSVLVVSEVPSISQAIDQSVLHEPALSV